MKNRAPGLMSPGNLFTRRGFTRAIGFAVAGIAAARSDSAEKIPLGANISLKGRRILPEDNPWNADISREPADPNSDALVASIGLEKSLHPEFGTAWQGVPSGIPYVVVDGRQQRVPVTFQYADESDPGPYPIPPDAPIEGGPNGKGDRHVLVLDRDNWKLYEIFSAHPQDGGKSWRAASGAVFDLRSNKLRPRAGLRRTRRACPSSPDSCVTTR